MCVPQKKPWSSIKCCNFRITLSCKVSAGCSICCPSSGSWEEAFCLSEPESEALKPVFSGHVTWCENYMWKRPVFVFGSTGPNQIETIRWQCRAAGAARRVHACKHAWGCLREFMCVCVCVCRKPIWPKGLVADLVSDSHSAPDVYHVIKASSPLWGKGRNTTSFHRTSTQHSCSTSCSSDWQVDKKSPLCQQHTHKPTTTTSASLCLLIHLILKADIHFLVVSPV